MSHVAVVEDALHRLQQGQGVWIQGPPGSGRSHLLRQIAARWPGEVLWIRAADLPWLAALPASVLLCFDDAPAELARSALPTPRPLLATGALPGVGWSLLALEPLTEEESVQLFLQHAPGSGSMHALRRLARRLSGNPTAIIAAARRWPAEPLESILEEPLPDWPGLRPAYAALSDAAQDALAFLSRLPGPARHAGLVWCGQERGVQALVAAGWVSVSPPGIYTLSAALAEAVRPWRNRDVNPYFAWFMQEARARFADWTAHGGSPAWFRCGLWPTLAANPAYTRESWFFQAWLLSGESPTALLAALSAAGDVVPRILAARMASQAQQLLGERQAAAAILREALESDTPDQAHQRALAQLELAVAHHRLGDFSTAQVAYSLALQQLEAHGLPRDRLVCRTNMAAFDHARGALEQAQAGYQKAIEDAAALSQPRTLSFLCSNLGSLLLERGDLAAARAALQRAAHSLDPDLDAQRLALVRANQGVLELLEEHLDSADDRLREAIALLGESQASTLALCLARRCAIAVLQGHTESARQLHERATNAAPSGDLRTSQLVALWRALLEWSVGDRRSALKRRRASLYDTPSLTQTSGEARLAVLLLERLVARPGEVLLIGPGGRWFRPPGRAPVFIDRYISASLILAQLAQVAEDSPGTFCSGDELIAAGWPDEKITQDAARNRLAVNLVQLRKQGLRRLLQRTSKGWRLDPDFSVLLLQDDRLIE